MNIGSERFSRRQTLHNAGWFLAGKLLAALANLAWLVLVTRALLPQGEFAAYVSAIATLELALALSLFGLDWLLIRQLPAALTRGDGRGLRRLIVQALVARAACASGVALGLLGLAAALGTPALLASVPLPLLAALLVAEALLRLLRDTALESLAAQRLTQFGVLGRTLLALFGFGLLAAGDGLSAATVLGIELVAALLMLACVAAWVGKASRLAGSEPAALPFWASWRDAWQNYQASLLSYPMAPQALLLLVGSFAGSQLTALFGLSVRVFELLRNYVPGLLFMNVLRPRLIGRHAAHQDFAATAAEAQAISRWSAISVAPLLALLALYGDALLSLIAGQAISGQGLPLALMAATLLLRVHRQIGQLMVNCVGELSLLPRLALLGLLGWPLGALLAAAGQPLWGAVLILWWDELAWVLGLSLGLRRRGHAWAAQAGLLAGLLALAATSALLVGALPLPAGAVGMASGTLVVLALMFFALRAAGLLDWRAAWAQLKARD